MFIVVAIVIFGIFVGLSYTVFGSEGLSKELKIIFEDSIEQANYALKNNYLYDYYNSSGTLKVVSETKNSIQFKTNGYTTSSSISGDGLVVKSETILEPNKTYKMSYDMTLVDGDIERIAGHILLGERITYYLDGELLESKVYTKNDFFTHTYSENYPNDNEKHHIDIVFDTNLSSFDTDGNLVSNIFPDDSKVYIQPNRGKPAKGFEVLLENIILEPYM